MKRELADKFGWDEVPLAGQSNYASAYHGRSGRSGLAVKKKLVVFVDEWTNAIIPVYERMKTKGFNVRLVAPQRKARHFPKLLSPLKLFWPRRVSCKADLYVVTIDDLTLTPLRKTILHFHGIGLEDASRIQALYGAIFVPGQKWLDQYKRLFPRRCHDKLRPVGFPPIDRLFSAEIKARAKELMHELNLEGRQTVLFAALAETNQRESAVLDRALAELERAALDLNVNLLVKPHVLSNPERYQVFEARNRQRDHIHYIPPEADILPLFHVSDVLVSGRCSSVINEFMTLDRPTIQLRDGDALPFFDVGLHCEVPMLTENLQRSLRNPAEFSVDRQKWTAYHVYQPEEGAIEREISEIEKLL